MKTDLFRFTLVDVKYQNLICSWLQQTHVAEWFCGQGLENTIKELDEFIHGSSIFSYWLALDQNHPFALLITSSIDKPSDELTRWCSESGDAITLDILIGDPDMANLRAIHVYKKAGFKIVGEFVPSHSAQLHYMMRLTMSELLAFDQDGL